MDHSHAGAGPCFSDDKVRLRCVAWKQSGHHVQPQSHTIQSWHRSQVLVLQLPRSRRLRYWSSDRYGPREDREVEPYLHRSLPRNNTNVLCSRNKLRSLEEEDKSLCRTRARSLHVKHRQPAAQDDGQLRHHLQLADATHRQAWVDATRSDEELPRKFPMQLDPRVLAYVRTVPEFILVDGWYGAW